MYVQIKKEIMTDEMIRKIASEQKDQLTRLMIQRLQGIIKGIMDIADIADCSSDTTKRVVGIALEDSDKLIETYYKKEEG